MVLKTALPQVWNYHYDLNGNMKEDKNKGLAAIEYNLLNLPRKLIDHLPFLTFPIQCKH